MVAWKIDEAKDLPLAIIEDTPEGMGVCEIGERTPENMKRAHLIKAAPDLLDALEAVATLLKQGQPLDPEHDGAYINAAIAKARG